MQKEFENIILSLDFLQDVVNRRLKNFFQNVIADPFSFPKDPLKPDNIHLAYFPANYHLNIEEYIILLLALVPHIQPNFLDSIVQTYLPNGGDFPEMGGIKGSNHRGMLPTGETALFILAGNDISKKVYASRYFQAEHFFKKENILSVEDVKDEPRMSGRLILSREWQDKLLFGRETAPEFSADFPAKLITTAMEWNDLVLNHHTLNQVNDLKIWLEHNTRAMEDPVLKRKIKPGYRVLFYGPAGTGKTLTATLLGQQFNKDVYRIDLSQVVSKYIGETEKNLEKIFSKAEDKGWILFFDEADALFGKRTNVQNAHDRYANQEVSYLLQRVEEYPGLLILASNFKNNIDDAFARRFHSIIHFPAPSAAERLTLWQKTMPALLKAEPEIQLKVLSEKYDLTGSAILQAVHYATLKSFARSDEFIRLNDLMEGIKREYRKEEKTINH
jgi:ATPase family associated with various cellular activities (AAA)